MVPIKIVTGYVPIPGHPRTAADYGELGEWFKTLEGVPIQPNYSTIPSCWMYNMIEALPFEPTWSKGDNAEKNSLGYHIVNHQKFEWLYQASRTDDIAETFIWMDYGIRHILGENATREVMDFLERVKPDDLAIPGCWPKGQVIDQKPCWRFCGSMMIVPRKHVQDLKNLVQAISMLHVRATKHVTWEVNTLARAEQTGKVPIRWYKADHNDSMFTEY